MAIHVEPDLSAFQPSFEAATSSLETLVSAVTNDPAYWLTNLKALHETYRASDHHTNSLRQEIKQTRIQLDALENADSELHETRRKLERSLGAQEVYKDQLRLAQLGPAAATSSKSPTHPDPEKFSGDKLKLELFVTQLHIKLQRNADHFIHPGQDTEQNKLCYSISRLEGDAFLHVKPYVTATKIDLPDVAKLVELLETRFGEVDPVGSAKHELYRLYQTNKDLDVFLNTFLILAKKAKFDDSQTLDLLYEKLSDEFQSRLVSQKKQTNLDDLIRKLRQMDANMKMIKPRRHGRSNNTS